MSIDQHYYSELMCEYARDIDQFSGVLKGRLREGDVTGAREMLKEIETQSYSLINAAKNAIRKATESV